MDCVVGLKRFEQQWELVDRNLVPGDVELCEVGFFD